MEDGKQGVCALCQKPGIIRESHIIPEFAYKPIYGDMHRMLVFNPMSDENGRFEQKGFRSPLLCDSHEGHLNDNYEKPFKKMWIDSGVLSHLNSKKDTPVTIDDYAKFKLFHLSVLWRASVSQHPIFSNVNLGPHQEQIRCMLLKKDAGQLWQYPIVCAALLNNEEQVHDNLIVKPIRKRLYGQNVYHFVFCGCRWLYFVGSHSIPSEFLKICLQENGQLHVTRQGFSDLIDFLKNSLRLGGA